MYQRTRSIVWLNERLRREEINTQNRTSTRRLYAARPEKRCTRGKGKLDRKLIPLNGSTVSFYSIPQRTILVLEGSLPTHTARLRRKCLPEALAVWEEGRWEEIFMHTSVCDANE